jgi:hypothetical protein
MDTKGLNKLIAATSSLVRDQTPGPLDPLDYNELISRLAAAEGTLPPAYHITVLEPLVSFVRDLGPNGFANMLAADPHREGLARCLLDVAQAVLQNAEGFEHRLTDAFQETVSDLYDGFLSAEDRLGVELPDRGVLPPLVKWGEPAFGPYTWPIEVVARFGVGCTIVSLPPAYSRAGMLAWAALGHETAGHDILNADTGLIGELAHSIQVAMDQEYSDPLVTDAWLSWSEEAASDVMGVLNMGPSAAFGVVAYLKAVRGKPTSTGKLGTEGSSRNPHPVDLLRAYVAAEALRCCLYSSNEEDADQLEEIATRDVTNIEEAIVVDGRGWNKKLAVESARCFARTVAMTRFSSLERHTLSSIQNWRQRDEQIVELLIKLLEGREPSAADAERLMTDAYATHVVAAGVKHALRTGEDGGPIFVAMSNILAAMHDNNPAWGPLFVIHPGNLVRHSLGGSESVSARSSNAWLVPSPFGYTVRVPSAIGHRRKVSGFIPPRLGVSGWIPWRTGVTSLPPIQLGVSGVPPIGRPY